MHIKACKYMYICIVVAFNIFTTKKSVCNKNVWDFGSFGVIIDSNTFRILSQG